MPLTLDQMLGINCDSPTERLASELVEEHRALFRDLVELRKEANLSVEEVSARMGIPVQDVEGIESGQRDIHLSTLRRYAHAVRGRILHTVRHMDTVNITGAGNAPWATFTGWAHSGAGRSQSSNRSIFVR